jgi:integrase
MSLEQLNLLEIMSSDSALNCQSESEELKTVHDVKSQSCSRLSKNEPQTKPENRVNEPTLYEYAEGIQYRIWPGTHHRNSAMRGIRWFSAFNGYGKLKVGEVKRSHIYNFVEHLKKTRGISDRTANLYSVYITRVIREANEQEITDNQIKVKLKKTVSNRPRAFSRDEEERLVHHLRQQGRDWLADMVILSCNTGMRRGEIVNINHPLVERSEDGKWLYLPAAICKTGERHVPLNTEAQMALERLVTSIGEYTPTKFRRAWEKARFDIARNDKHFVFHVCRHTAASRLANELAVNEALIAQILGHTDTRTTRKYVHPNKNALMSAVERL